MTKHHQLLVMRAAETDPLIEQHLATCLLDRVAEVLVLFLAVGERVQVRTPHQPFDDDAPLGGAAEHFGDRGAALAHLLVRIAAPVREKHVVAGAQRLDLGRKIVEVCRPVDQRFGAAPLTPGGQVRERVTALGGGEEPFRQIMHASGVPRNLPTECISRR